MKFDLTEDERLFLRQLLLDDMKRGACRILPAGRAAAGTETWTKELRQAESLFNQLAKRK